MNKVTIRKTKAGKDGTCVISIVAPDKKTVICDGPQGAFAVEVLPTDHVKFVRVAFNPKEFGEDLQSAAKRALSKKEKDGWVGDVKCMLDAKLRVGGTHQLVALVRSVKREVVAGQPMEDDMITLGDAITLVREIERLLCPTAHAALAGGVLMKGFSTKDIDIHIYSHNTKNPYNKEAVMSILSALLTDPFQTTSNYVDKDVVLFQHNGHRVDVFFQP